MKSITEYFNKLYRCYFSHDEFFLLDIKKILTWLLGNNITEISKYLCKVYTGLDNENTVIWYPVSYGDFARCYEFFSLLTDKDVTKLLNKVAEKNEIWKFVYDNYSSLLSLYKKGDVEGFSKVFNPVIEKHYKKF